MFEQHLQDIEPEVPAPQEGDIFANYEVGRWVLSPRIYKIFAASAIGVFATFALMAQTNILTARGCDGFFVSRVCQVLDTVYVATVLAGTEREYAEFEYEKTELEDADITFIDVGGSNAPLTYPPGYFQIANPVQFAMQQQMANDPTAGMPPAIGSPMPAFNPPPSNTGGVLNKKQKLPRSNPNALDGDVVGGFDTGDDETPAGDNPTRKGQGKNRPGGDQTAQAKPTPTPASTPAGEAPKADAYGVVINKLPIKRFGASVLKGIDDKSIDITRNFKATVRGTLTRNKDQVVVLTNVKPVISPNDPPSDPAMEKLAMEAVIAAADAGWLGYLEKVNVKSKDITISIEQNDNEFIVNLLAVEASESAADNAAGALSNLLLVAGAVAGGDEKEFLSLASPTSKGKTFVLKIQGPKQKLQDLIQRKLAESRSKDDTMNNAVKPAGSNNTAKR